MLFLFTTVSIFSMFIINGIYMEYNISHTYGGKKFNFGTGMIIIQSILVAIIALAMKFFSGEKINKNIFNKQLILAAFFQCLALYFTNLATFRLDFLMKILIRSSKFITVLLGTLIFSNDH